MVVLLLSILGLIAAVAVGCVMCVYAYKAQTIFNTMAAEVNAKLPTDKQIGTTFGYPGLVYRIESLHRQFYPDSQMRRDSRRAMIVSFSLLLVEGLLLLLSMRGLGLRPE